MMLPVRQGDSLMLIALMKDQLVTLQTVCQTCLMADGSGRPRWDGANLRCGRQLADPGQNHPVQYECQMGFRIAEIN